jgi:hypothetical protein
MKRKYFLIAFLVVLILGVASILWMWDEPIKKVENETEIALTVDKLCHDFTVDESTADSMYLHRAIQLKGQITELSNNMDGGIMMVFAASNNIDDVECILREETAELKIGSVVTVKGFCSGKTITGIALSDCIIVP